MLASIQRPGCWPIASTTRSVCEQHRYGLQAKLREWAGRYLPAELTGTVAALAAAWAEHAASGSLAAAAVAGVVGENLGYYGCMAAREALGHHARHRQHRRGWRLWLTASRTIRDLLVEFGPAELVDSLVARPFLMYLLPALLHQFAAGILAGKLAADLVFYSLAVAAYELRERWLSPPRPESTDRMSITTESAGTGRVCEP